MRCDEVAQELSAPTGRPDRGAMARHLAACPRCAAWVEKMEKLDRLWEASQPIEPPPTAFDQVWASVNHALASEDAPALVARNGQARVEPETIPPFESERSRPTRHRWVVGLLAPLAAAAALWLAFHDPGVEAPDSNPVASHDDRPDEPSPTEIALNSFDFDQGGVAIIHIGEDGPPRIEERPLAPVSDTETIAATFDMLNYVETLSDFQGAL